MSKIYPQKNLYKYYAARRWSSMFKDWTIRFTPIAEFNDPFEGQPAAQNIWGPEFDKKFPNNHGIPYVMVNAEMNEEDKKALRTEILQDLCRMGIFCLTTEPGNLLMWSHYGESHRGFAVEFNMNSSFFLKEYSDRSWQPREVRYVMKRPVVRYLSDTIIADDQTEFNEAFIYTKGNIWEYEREHRMLCSLELPEFKCREVNGIRGIHDIPKDAVSGVIFGACMDMKDIEVCCKDLSRPDCARIRLQKAELHPEDYSLSFKDL